MVCFCLGCHLPLPPRPRRRPRPAEAAIASPPTATTASGLLPRPRGERPSRKAREKTRRKTRRHASQARRGGATDTNSTIPAGTSRLGQRRVYRMDRKHQPKQGRSRTPRLGSSSYRLLTPGRDLAALDTRSKRWAADVAPKQGLERGWWPRLFVRKDATGSGKVADTIPSISTTMFLAPGRPRLAPFQWPAPTKRCS